MTEIKIGDTFELPEAVIKLNEQWQSYRTAADKIADRLIKKPSLLDELVICLNKAEQVGTIIWRLIYEKYPELKECGLSYDVFTQKITITKVKQ